MLLRSRKPRFRGWSEKDVRTSRRIRRGMPLLPPGLGKTARSTRVILGHADSLVSGEQLALAGCYSKINDGANTSGLRLPFALCGERRFAVETRNDAHTMPSSPTGGRPIGIRRQPSNRVFWRQGRLHLAWQTRHVASLDMARDGVISWEQGWRCRKRRPALHTGARLKRRDHRFAKSRG